MMALTNAAAEPIVRVGAVGLSYYPESVIVLGVTENGICYPNINWTLFSMDTTKYTIASDGMLLTNGTIQGAIRVTTNMTSDGLHRLTVTIGATTFAWNVIVINESAEVWVGENVYGMAKNIRVSPTDLLLLQLKTFAIAIAFFFVPFPVVFPYIVKRKEMEARQLV